MLHFLHLGNCSSTLPIAELMLIYFLPCHVQCCRAFANGTHCPPPDQPPCADSPEACAECSTCFAPAELPSGRPDLHQFQVKGSCGSGAREFSSITSGKKVWWSPPNRH